MNDAYLRETVGPVLAEGIAITLEANPANPVHYLGRWILDQLDRKAEAANIEPRAAALKAARDEWQAESNAERTYAACRIQNTVRTFLKRVRARAARREELVLAIDTARATAEAAHQPTLEPADDRTDQEVEADSMYEKAAAEMVSAKAALAAIQPADMLTFAAPYILRPFTAHPNTIRIIRAIMYTCRDVAPSTVATAPLALSYLKPRLLLTARGCDVLAPAARRRGFQRARRVARVIDLEADAARTANSPVEGALASFVAAAVELRRAAEHRAELLRELGREVPDINLNPDDDDDDNEDVDVANVKLVEAAERSALAAEAEAEAEEDA